MKWRLTHRSTKFIMLRISLRSMLQYLDDITKSLRWCKCSLAKLVQTSPISLGFVRAISRVDGIKDQLATVGAARKRKHFFNGTLKAFNGDTFVPYFRPYVAGMLPEISPSKIGPKMVLVALIHRSRHAAHWDVPMNTRPTDMESGAFSSPKKNTSSPHWG